ncbi:MAG: cell division protein FtsQ/DivIB [Nitrosopumilus sp.]|nr:cell division protein FtsQ/DivIB [Nitrosopumilus sp.]MDA7945539.1 cell division protein FtsQ/DivIB [Nitrosopumilus sp.]MDA7955125.1 cell division protein FtsQ/DivIB [Nitrosopumilus sp.]MDA7974172.1 cell division protein FtsQ/DivIB [Nitrosopumilus sp.]
MYGPACGGAGRMGGDAEWPEWLAEIKDVRPVSLSPDDVWQVMLENGIRVRTPEEFRPFFDRAKKYMEDDQSGFWSIVETAVHDVEYEARGRGTAPS